MLSKINLIKNTTINKLGAIYEVLHSPKFKVIFIG